VATALGLCISATLFRLGRIGLLPVLLWTACAFCLLCYVARGWALSGTGLRGLAALLRAPVYVLWKFSVGPGAPLHGAWVRTSREERAP
jgi:hypothetical protein